MANGKAETTVKKEQSIVCRHCGNSFIIAARKSLVKRPQRRVCTNCITKQNEAWKQANPESVQAMRQRQAAKRLREVFNLSVADKQAILVFQGGVCAICKRPMNRANVDHDHVTGQIRGILCSLCNRALGKFKDSLERITAAFEYMRNFPATAALGAPRFGLPGRVDTKKQLKLRQKMRRAPLAVPDHILKIKLKDRPKV